MKKVILIALGVLFLSGCVQTTALLGPSVIGVQSGSIYKASLQYGANYMIKKSTGKSTSEHVLGLIQEPIKIRKEKRIRNNLTKLLERHILTTRATNLLNQHIFTTRKKLLKNN
jgi:PBP1b-binding outer membrane lipoprotein LpoB